MKSKLWLFLLCLVVAAAQAQQPSPQALRDRFAEVSAKAAGKIVDRPVYLQSTEAEDRMQGDVYALIDQPYEQLRQSLSRADPWCGVLILHLNVQYCRASAAGAPQMLDVGIGRKFDQPLSEVYWVRFAFRVVSASADFLDVELVSPSGPLGTKDFRIVVEAVPLAEHSTLLHMTYAYAYGTMARWAMKAYLGTIGSDKIGFSVAGKDSDGKPIYIGGLRGVLERNTMRYYLAIESYLAASALPAPQRQQQRLQDWFAATERYAPQLHELDRDEYLEMKQREIERQKSEPPPAH